MYIQGPIKSGKTSTLLKEFLTLLNSGVKCTEILVITSNSFKKTNFLKKVKEELQKTEYTGSSALPIHTFNGIVYNSVQSNWPLIEDIIQKIDTKTTIFPDLCGLETTEYVLKTCLKDKNFSDYRSKINLVHQLLRRYRLINENCLEENEVVEKSKFLAQAFYEDAQEALKDLKKQTFKLRSFDYLRQTNVFLYLLAQNLIKDFENIKYLIVDDLDELSYSALMFIKYLMPKVDQFYIAADVDGGARQGYLCAYLSGFDELKSEFPSEILNLECKKNTHKDGCAILANLENGENNILDNFELSTSKNRSIMIDSAVSKLETLLSEGVEPENISIILSMLDVPTKFALKNYFEKANIQHQFLSGTKKRIDNPLIRNTLLIAQLANPQWALQPTSFEARTILTDIFALTLEDAKKIIDKYKKSFELPPALILGSDLNHKYAELLNLIQEIKEKELPLNEQLMKIMVYLMSVQSYEYEDITEFNSVFKSLASFYKVIEKLSPNENTKILESEWIIQTKNSVVSDNPVGAPEILQNSVLIITHQKAVDLEIETDYQIWLDVSDRSWIRDDEGPLYNSWVFQKNWDKPEYTPEMHRALTLKKTGHLLRKLTICANKKIFAFASEMSIEGTENLSGLSEFIHPVKIELSTEKPREIKPRKDQLPVLEYKSGTMAVPAVPGAGKTTIMQALIISMINSGIEPQEILVLTYMESAARNFQDRIKKNCPNLPTYPHISTIHGLALKIIQDDENFAKLGLSSDFRIADDTQRPQIIRDICLKYLPEGESIADWIDLNTRGISKAKLESISVQHIGEYLKKYPDNQRLGEFLPIYKEYISTLKEKDLLDYDDLLVMAYTILKDYPAVRSFYQQQYKYIIEDEAQDSRRIQQNLIALIAGEDGNLIRCGDINQAIMTTFSESDVEGFKQFISNSKKNVEMISSQRCAKGVYELANFLVGWASKHPDYKDAFYPLMMQPVENSNPDIPDNVKFEIYDDSIVERNLVIENIKKHLEATPDATVGLLVRTNFQVEAWTRELVNNGVKIYARNDLLKNQKVFTFLAKFLEVLETPWKNALILDLYEEFIDKGFIDKDLESLVFLKNLDKKTFINLHPTELSTENLSRFWWDIFYWLESTNIAPEELITRIGFTYFTSNIDRANIQMISNLVKKYILSFNDYGDKSKTVDLSGISGYFKELKKQRKFSGMKLFTELDTQDDKDALAGCVQVMTLHKSKGDEFDVVFIPEMNEDTYSFAITPDNITIKADSELVAELEKVGNISNEQCVEDLKQKQINEILRLIYVGITRAKKYLYMSSSHKKFFSKGQAKDNVPSKLLEVFINEYSKVGVHG